MGPGRRPRPVTVIGVGNDFRGDDGVGWAVVARLRDSAKRAPLPAGTVLQTGDGDAARLMSTWEGTSAAIMIDAARSGPSARPGSVRRLELDSAPQWLTTGQTSSHGFGLATAFELAHALGRLPHTLIMYTIESADFDLGIGLSRRVGAAVHPVARRIERDIRRLAGWHGRRAVDDLRRTHAARRDEHACLVQAAAGMMPDEYSNELSRRQFGQRPISGSAAAKNVEPISLTADRTGFACTPRKD